MERTASHPANRRLLHGLTPETRRLLAEHLREVHAAHRRVLEASDIDSFEEAIHDCNNPSDFIAADIATKARFVYLDTVTVPPFYRLHAKVWAVTGTGHEWLRDNKPASSAPSLLRVPAREPLMGERSHVASLAVAA